MADEKILKDEIISDEQLDEVAGGTHDETYQEMNYLYKHFGIGFFGNDWDRSVGKLGELYRRAGMKLDTSERHENKYFDGYSGRRISRDEANIRLVDAIRNGLNTNVW